MPSSPSPGRASFLSGIWSRVRFLSSAIPICRASTLLQQHSARRLRAQPSSKSSLMNVEHKTYSYAYIYFCKSLQNQGLKNHGRALFFHVSEV